MLKQSVYLASPFFSDEQIARVKKVKALLEANPTIDSDNIYQPMQHQNEQFEFGSTEWKRATFQADLRQVDNSDVVVLIMDYKVEEGSYEPDSGTIMELGYAFAHNTPIIIAQFDENDAPLNLMVAEAYTAYFWKEDVAELATYDFNTLEYVPTKRTVF
ncbi:nucleoside 2-deoxyribosyltransferase [Periweissella cryptocerci]|uniref:Nucleoside 2-deoxyribosyltransferase n=1 Tax=Periweissella cryptocerci TaxID=2506420 RepID=A0A4P6YSE5_9LACO|nr:nucleoside 2-deoxyribosyltransferase [Periweissella cryptocerci]QBO35576.1 nucleoside 2-deoxyribosyltransferase [Periweissella cryptocerci]